VLVLCFKALPIISGVEENENVVEDKKVRMWNYVTHWKPMGEYDEKGFRVSASKSQEEMFTNWRTIGIKQLKYLCDHVCVILGSNCYWIYCINFMFNSVPLQQGLTNKHGNAFSHILC
jgi:hypothetical protein